MFDRWPERDHIHARKLLADDPAFQSGMDSDDFWLFAEYLYMDVLKDLQQRRFQIGGPPRVTFRLSDFPSGKMDVGFVRIVIDMELKEKKDVINVFIVVILQRVVINIKPKIF